jgi:hypothetical protein
LPENNNITEGYFPEWLGPKEPKGEPKPQAECLVAAEGRGGEKSDAGADADDCYDQATRAGMWDILGGYPASLTACLPNRILDSDHFLKRKAANTPAAWPQVDRYDTRASRGRAALRTVECPEDFDRGVPSYISC